jgi:putative pyruvate formate lyase activating enzyme
MDQYFPAFHAHKHPTVSRRITEDEYEEAIDLFEKAGLKNGWIQDHSESTGL